MALQRYVIMPKETNASESTCIRVLILQFAFDLQVLSTGEIVTEAEDEH
jgi:hypothetical protein